MASTSGSSAAASTSATTGSNDSYGWCSSTSRSSSTRTDWPAVPSFEHVDGPAADRAARRSTASSSSANEHAQIHAAPARDRRPRRSTPDWVASTSTSSRCACVRPPAARRRFGGASAAPLRALPDTTVRLRRRGPVPSRGAARKVAASSTVCPGNSSATSRPDHVFEQDEAGAAPETRTSRGDPAGTCTIARRSGVPSPARRQPERQIQAE